MHSSNVLDVAIIGCGFSGLCMAIQLKEAGYSNFKVFEKADQIGGTWRDNTYPGCACDVKSHLYCYSFEPNPNWSHAYSGWQEIQDYINHCADKYQVRSHIELNAPIQSAVYLPDQHLWQITTDSGEQHLAKLCVLATGALHIPKMPNLKGLSDFKGPSFHSAQWDHSVDLNGKKVVSIGTGGSAIQYVPEIAKQVEQLTVFQRSPAWVVPRDDSANGPFKQFIFKHIPGSLSLYRRCIYLFNELRIVPMRRAWMVRIMEWYAKRSLKRQVPDPVIREKLTPNYTIGCKRVLISNTYWPTFMRNNVTLNTDGIQEINADGVTDANGKFYPADVLILGTGFQADPREYLQSMEIKGTAGEDLKKVWHKGAEGFLGMTVHGFPNFFQLLGPNTLLGHNSVLYIIEAQVQFIIRSLQTLNEKQAKALDVKQEYQDAFNFDVSKRLDGSVWNSGCNSWYQQDSGKNFSIWPGATFIYKKKTKQVKDEFFEWIS